MGTATNIVQVNARLSRSLRDEGESALASIGLTPSAAIRALWEKAAQRGESLEQVKSLLVSEPDLDPVVAEKLEAFHRGQQEIARALQDMGLSLDGPPSSLSDKELLEEALVERMRERGLM